MTQKEPKGITDPPKDIKKNRWSWLNQRNFETLAEFIAGCLLAFHLLPHSVSEYVSGTQNGLFIVLALVILYVLRAGWRHIKSLIAIISQNNESLSKKDGEIKELVKNLSTSQQEYAELNKTTNYSRILSTINKAFAELRQGNRENASSPDGERLKGTIKEFCNTLHEVFDVLKGSEGKTCHVCIKICTMNEKEVAKSEGRTVVLKAKTLIRDGRGDGTRSKIDSLTHIQHHVAENTAFMHILEQSDSNNLRYFMSNDVLTIDDYQNTSLRAVKENKDTSFYKYNHAPMEQKIDHWKLPYRSTIVAPISPGMVKVNVEDGTFIGFLCVDYDAPNIFNQADIDIVEGFAEGLYDTLHQYLTQYILK